MTPPRLGRSDTERMLGCEGRVASAGFGCCDGKRAGLRRSMSLLEPPTDFGLIGSIARLLARWIIVPAKIDAVGRPPQATVGMKTNNARTKSGNRVRNLDAE